MPRRGRRHTDAVAYIPERPIDNAVVADLDLALNLDLRHARELDFFPRDGDRTRAPGIARPLRREASAPCASRAALSGGNLQKLVIARELSQTPRLVIACYPTMGLDVMAAQAVYREMFDHAARGAAVVWFSEDLDDLLDYAHRIAVMHDGRYAGIVRATRPTATDWAAGWPAIAAEVA